MYGQRFYNETTRRYVAVFGTLFNDIVISRTTNDGSVTQQMKVPIHYAPMQKLLARLEQDPNLTAPAMTLPRMSFEIVGMSYDGERKIPSLNRIKAPESTDSTRFQSLYSPAPYNLEFQLNIMTKYNEDGTKILEQILPYFKPGVTPSVKIMDELDMYVDIPVVLNSVSNEDVYEGSFEERRALIWTLDFTLKGFYFGPVTKKKIIKFVDVNFYDSLDTSSDIIEGINIQPGLTANGEPTTDINETIAYSDIEFDDDWAYIVRIVDE